MPSSTEWELGSVGSSSSSNSSFDDDEVNARVIPHWSKYRDLITSQGYRLDTVRDVKEHYQRHGIATEKCAVDSYLSGYLRACAGRDDDALCKDPGLVRGQISLSRFLFLIAISQKISSEPPAARLA
jgi:hypothetical protein